MGLEMDGHGKFFVADPDKPTWVESVYVYDLFEGL